MTNQLELPVESPMTHKLDPETARQAAEVVRPHLRALQLDLYATLLTGGPITAKEAENLPPYKRYSPSTIRKRISELAQGGWLKATGVERDGCTEYRAATAGELSLILARLQRARGA